MIKTFSNGAKNSSKYFKMREKAHSEKKKYKKLTKRGIKSQTQIKDASE